MSGYVNQQNCRYPLSRQAVEQPFHKHRVTAWCGFWVSEVTGPYFFENDAGAVITVNALRYQTMLTDFSPGN